MDCLNSTGSDMAAPASPSPAGPSDDWMHRASIALARFVNLTAEPDRDEWAKNASEAIRLLREPEAFVTPAALSDGFDGSDVRPGPNHSTVEIWYATEAQARAAHRVIRDLIDGSATAGAREPVAWDASQIKQPGWNHVEAAFLNGAREARTNPEADDAMFKRAADGYTKRVFEEVDPVSEAALRTGSWQRAEAQGGGDV